VLDQRLFEDAAAPSDIADLPKPILGVIGNLSGNMDWILIADFVDKVANASFVFVAPTMVIRDPARRPVRQNVLARAGASVSQAGRNIASCATTPVALTWR
jgi:hypothetical protein